MPEVHSVALAFWLGSGSRDEGVGEEGACHFLEHLIFKGTDQMSAADIAQAFDSVGGEANAFSTKEYTCFYARVLGKDLKFAVQILADIIERPAIRPDELEGERNVILEEIAMHGDTPEDLVHDLFIETLYPDHPLGREVMGTISTVRAMTPEGLRQFHARHYRQNNIVFSAAGDVDHAEVVELLSSATPPGTSNSDPSGRSEPPARAIERLRVLTRPTEQVHLVVGGIGYPQGNDRRFAWAILDVLLGGGMSSRLFQEVRETRGLAYSIYSYRNTYRDTGLWAVYAGCAPGNVKEVLKVISGDLDAMCSSGITEEELKRAKGHLIGGFVIGLEDPVSRMTRLGRSELGSGEILSIDENITRIEAVTLEDVAAVARDLLAPSGRVLTLIGPTSVEDFSFWADAG